MAARDGDQVKETFITCDWVNYYANCIYSGSFIMMVWEF
jgi:hypothetical protein